MPAKFADLTASADFLGNGAIETNRYETEIVDLIRRKSVALQRFPSVPATGHPHRYFEQTGIAQGAFTDPRNIAPTATGPNRTERTVFIKAITGQSNFSMFDVEVTKMQGQFAAVEARDIQDITSGIVTTAAQAIWSGTDTSLTTPTTVQYMGLLNQISTLTSTVASGASIIDALKSQVAQILANQTFDVRPSAIYINPVLGDYIDREAKAQVLDLDKVEVTAGVWVKALMTQAGPLPLVSDPWLPTVPAATTAYGFTTPAGLKGYPAVIIAEDMIEMPYVSADGNDKPRLFQLGLLAGLQTQFVGAWFNSIVAKGSQYGHAVVMVFRP